MSLNSLLHKIGRYGRVSWIALQKLGPIKYYPLIFTLIALCFLATYRLVGLEAFFYDAAIRFDPRPPSLAQFRFVTLDEDSDELLGETFPYSYFGHYRMLSRLLETRPRIVISFVPFLEPQNEQQQQDMQAVRQLIEEFRQAGGEFYFALDYGTWAMQTLPSIFQDLPQIFAVINPDESNFAQDQVVRRTLLQVGHQTTLHLLVANKMRSAQGLKSLAPQEVHGHTYLPSTDAHYALSRMAHKPYFRQDGQVATFFEVVTGRFAAEDWRATIVLYGPQYAENHNDLAKTPFTRHSAATPKLLVHASMMAALAENKGVQVAAPWVSTGIMWFMALLLISILLQARPRQTFLWPLTFMLLTFGMSYVVLAVGGWSCSPVPAALGIGAIYLIWIPFRTMIEYQGRISTEEEAKMWQKLEGLKRNFISLMSHDLKTPVAKVAALAEVLQRQVGEDAAANKNVIAIQDTAKDLNRFISAILDLAKVEAQEWQTRLAPKDLNQLLENVVATYQRELAQAKMRCVFNLAPLYPLETDEALLQRVMSNLVENAIHYAGEDKTITITTAEDGAWVVTQIADNGQGIREEDVPHIFDKFYRGKDTRKKGTGLGLYLVKYFVELLGGMITVQSVWGRGTTFRILLPNR